MLIESSYLFSQLDPAKKDAKWADHCLTLIRRNWVQLKDSNTMRINKQIIFGQQSMEPIRKMFKDKQFLKDTTFIPLGVWSRIINILAEELTKAPPKSDIRAVDITALTDKEEDIRRLRMKAMHEYQMNQLSKKVGEPPTIINSDKFKTNVDEFYRMGLDPSAPEDIDFYIQHDFPRLKYEIAAQKILTAVMELNRFDKELIRDAVLDIAAGLCFCVQAFVDQVTGEIRYDRIYPEQAYGVWGDKRDGSDDVGKGWMKNITVREWLGRVGNDFSFERDWMHLLWALNYTNRTKYTGFVRYGNRYDLYGNPMLWEQSPPGMYEGVAQSNLMDYSLAYTYNIYVGYSEWDSPEATATYLAKFGTGEVIPNQIPFDAFLEDKEETKEYYKESWYANRMYKTYFLPTSSTTQWIYNFGKLYMQNITGAYDQYCEGTLMYYRLEGNSAAEISKPYVEFANLCYYRMKWIVYHSKPQEEQFVIEELIKVAKTLQRQFPQNAASKVPTVDNILTQLIQWKRENFIDVRSYPEIEGKTYPVLPPQRGDRGGALDPLALGLQAVEQWLEMQIAEKVGLNDIRLGQIQNEREGYKRGVEETKSSLNSTSYFYRMIQYTKEHIALTTLNYAQDIVKFKDSIPYNWLLKLVGEDEFINAQVIDDFSAHRYSLFIDDYSSYYQKQRLMQAADLALDKGDGRGGITIYEWGLLNNSEDYNDALKKLALFKYKADKKKRGQELQTLQIQQNNSMQLEDQRAKNKQNEDAADIEKNTIMADAQKYVADRNAGSKAEVTDMKIRNEPVKQDQRTEDKIKIDENKVDLKAQEPLAT